MSLRRALGGMLLLLVSGCGRSEVFEPPASPPTVPAVSVAELCEGGGEPKVDQARSPKGARIRWTRGGCLEVTYEPELEDFVPGLLVGLDAWSAPSCTSMCFLPPHPRKSGGAAPRGVHLRRIIPSDLVDPSTLGSTSATYDLATGALRSAEILLAAGRAPTRAEFLHFVGQTLGFTRTETVSTVLDGVILDALSTADEQSVCAVYPRCAGR